MNAPANASQLENPGDYVAQGIADVINADTPRSPFPAFGPRTPEKMAKNRVEVRAGAFTRGSDHMQQAPNGNWYYDHKRGQFQLTVVSQRQSKTNTGPETTHALAVGRCRFLVSRFAQRLIPNAVGGLQIADLIDQGELYTAAENFDTDRTEMRFQVDLVLPPGNYADT